MTDINAKLWEQAKKLAARNYEVEISEDTLTNGERVYIVRNPELRGCMAQGATLADALDELNLARINYIYFKLVDGRPVNPPHVGHTTTTANTNVALSQMSLKASSEGGGTLTMYPVEDFPNTVTQAEERDSLAKVSVIEGDFIVSLDE